MSNPKTPPRTWIIKLTDVRAESAADAERRLSKLLQLSLPTLGYTAAVIQPITANRKQA